VVGHVIVLVIRAVRPSDAGCYECVVKPFDEVAVAATVNFVVYGKNIYMYSSNYCLHSIDHMLTELMSKMYICNSA